MAAHFKVVIRQHVKVILFVNSKITNANQFLAAPQSPTQMIAWRLVLHKLV